MLTSLIGNDRICMKCLANSELSASKATANSVLFFSNAGVEGFEEPCMYACMCMYVCMLELIQKF